MLLIPVIILLYDFNVQSYKSVAVYTDNKLYISRYLLLNKGSA